MTNLLKQIHLSQQQYQPPSPQHSQQMVPQRICGICADSNHYTDECPQLQHEDNTVTATHNFYDRPNQGYYQQGGNYNQGGNFNQGWRDNYNRGGRDSQGNQRWNNNDNQQNRYPQNPTYQQQNQI
ncbi:eukaryotic peptide chain release factor GTP-binding subunit-like [Arachis stenosperma]|uniref:eukaryotic peptide chain release factor GTP-binding subunit-like n=1 Tax=Arachis stenosperma TaxID=217475 RepID=UPI0025ACAFEC|nr:eukaryotic peptide chain release factor GTP-binding subunit-like [Arachis stenosperma]